MCFFHASQPPPVASLVQSVSLCSLIEKPAPRQSRATTHHGGLEALQELHLGRH